MTEKDDRLVDAILELKDTAAATLCSAILGICTKATITIDLLAKRVATLQDEVAAAQSRLVVDRVIDAERRAEELELALREEVTWLKARADNYGGHPGELLRNRAEAILRALGDRA